MSCCGPKSAHFFHEYVTVIGTPIPVYTVAAGKTAEVHFVTVGNNDASTHQVKLWIDRSGAGTYDATTIIYDGKNIDANETLGLPVKWCLPAGTKIAVDADSANKIFIALDGVLIDDS